MKKNFPKEIMTYKIDFEKHTIAAIPFYRSEIHWRKGEDIFKIIIILCLSFSIFPLIYYSEKGTVWCLYTVLLLLSISAICIVSYLISSSIVEKHMWQKQVTFASSLQAEVIKAIYQASVAEVKSKLEEIRNKQSVTVAENEYYWKYREFLDSDKVDCLPVPIWSWLFEEN